MPRISTDHATRLDTRPLIRGAHSTGAMLDVSWRAADGTLEQQAVKVVTTPAHFGGVRAWVLCTCGRRRAVLWVAGGALGCMSCLGLVHAVVNESKSARALRRARRARARLRASLDVSVSLGRKPSGMHWATHQRLVMREAAAARIVGKHVDKIARRLRRLAG